MYEMAKKAREGMKAKARRLAGETVGKVDSSTWSPPPLLRADVKTGARPIMKLSKKGIGESNAARDTKAAIGNPTRGAFKQGGAVKDGGVLDKKAVGAVEVLPKRGKAENYKKGGRIKKAGGGSDDPSYVGASSVTKGGKPVTRPKDLEAKSQREPDASDLYTPEQAKRLEQGYKKGGKAKKIAKKKGGGVGLTVVIADKGSRGAQGQAPVAPIAPRAVPVPPAQMPPAAAAPPPAQMPPMARKAGGRITKVASSYKDMEAGAASGEGRLQKTDIAKKRKGAPAS